MALGIDRIAVVGHGLIGGSLELALRRLQSPPDVVTLDRRDDLGRAASADIVFLCAPIPENISILRELPSFLPGKAIITDTGSTKRTTVAAAGTLPPRLKFIGGHPMAGAASGGVSAASADLFVGRRWILTPTVNTHPGDLNAVQRLVESTGAVVRVMDPEEHDRIVAYVSHLPQLVVSALMQTVGDAVGNEGLEIAGTGLRDSTRLASSPAGMWQDVVESNADAIKPALDAVIDVLIRLRDNGGTGLPEIFADAGRWKQALDKGARTS